jgi:hypothetical protein
MARVKMRRFQNPNATIMARVKMRRFQNPNATIMARVKSGESNSDFENQLSS